MADDPDVVAALKQLDDALKPRLPSATTAPATVETDPDVLAGQKHLDETLKATTKQGVADTGYSDAGSASAADKMIPTGGPAQATPIVAPVFSIWPQNPNPNLLTRIGNYPADVATAAINSIGQAPGLVWRGVKEGYNTPNLLIAQPTQDALDANSTPLGVAARAGNVATGVIGGTASGLLNAGLNTIAQTGDALLPPNSGGSFGRDLAGMAEYELTRRATGDTAHPSGAPQAYPAPSNPPNLLSPEFKSKPTVEGFKPSASTGQSEPNSLLDGLKLDKDSTPNADPNSPQTSKFVDALHGAIAIHLGHAVGAGAGGAVGTVLGSALGPAGSLAGTITGTTVGVIASDMMREVLAKYGPKVASAVSKRMGVPLPSMDTVAKTGALRDQENLLTRGQ